MISTEDVWKVNISRPPARSHSFTSDPCNGNEASEASRRPSGLNASWPDAVVMTGEREPLPAGIGVEQLDHPSLKMSPTAMASIVPAGL